MASLSDFYQPASSTPMGYVNASIDQQAGDAAQNTGLQQTLAQRQFQTRTLPDIVNQQAGRGAFFSGATGVQSDRAREDFTGAQDQSTLQLQQTLSGLARQRILASLGVQL